MMQWRAAVGLLTLTILLLPAEVRSQEVAGSLDQLRASGLLKPGDAVYVTDSNGQRTKGMIRDLSATSLSLMAGQDTLNVTAMNVSKIERQDSLENGILIGLGIGVAVTAVWCKADPDPEHCPYIVGYFGLPAIAGGTILGAIFDAFIHKTLYLAPAASASSRLRLSPILSNDQKGMSIFVGF
jgi:hypothetical protein